MLWLLPTKDFIVFLFFQNCTCILETSCCVDKIVRNIILSMLLGIIAVLPTTAYAQQSQSKTVKEWIENIQASTELLFNYDPAILTSEKISIPTSNNSAISLLSYLEEHTRYHFTIVDNKYVLINVKRSGPSYNNITITATILDGVTMLPLPFADVYTSDFTAGNTTNDDGKFIIKGPINPNQNIIVRFLGYTNSSIPINDIISRKLSTITLYPSDQTLQNIIITDVKKPYISDDFKQATTLSSKNLPLIAGQSEKDPFIMVQTLPGVSGLAESASNISIRGSTSDQNLVLWNQIPIYHTGHFIGLLSSINPYSVDSIKVFNDGFKSNYGGRIAGVIDMVSSNDYLDKPAYSGNINLLTANVHAKIPIWKNKIQWSIGMRSSFSPLFKSVIYNNFFDQSFQFGRIEEINTFITKNQLEDNTTIDRQINFSDINTTLQLDPTENDRILLSYVNAKDLLTNNISFDWDNKVESDTIALRNYGFSSIWSHTFSPSYKLITSYIKSGFQNTYSFYNDISPNVSTNSRNTQNGVDESQIKLENHVNIGDITLEMGFHRTQINNLNYRKEFPTNVYIPNENTEKNAILNALFFNYNYKVKSTFNIDIGLRYSFYNITKERFEEPRMTVSQNINNRLSFKASAGIYTQVINQIESVNGIQVEDLFWRLADGQVGNELIPITKNSQYSVGMAYDYNDWHAEAVLFTKKVENITALGLDFDYGLNPYWIATGKSKGVELSIRKKYGAHFSMVNFGYNDMTLDFYGDRIFPAPYNYRNNLLLMHTFKTNKISLSLIFNLKSGLPYSQYDSYEIRTNDLGDPDLIFTYQGQYNQWLQWYNRIDVTASYQIFDKKKDKFAAVMGVTVLNLLDQNNILSRTNYVNYSQWPDILPGTFDRKGLGLTPNIFVRFDF